MCRSRTAPAPTDLLGGGLLEGQIPVREALAALKPLLEDRSVLKLGYNIKFELVVMNRHGLDIQPYDDTQLISYVLDGGTAAGHGIDELADKWLGHKVIKFKDLTGSGRASIGLDGVALEQGDGLRRRRSRHHLQALAGAEAAARRPKAWSRSTSGSSGRW